MRCCGTKPEETTSMLESLKQSSKRCMFVRHIPGNAELCKIYALKRTIIFFVTKIALFF